MNQNQIAPARISSVVNAAEAAARAIPPAFPLEATVAVNPFLGQTREDLATASARLARVAGASLTRPRADFAADIASGRITDEELFEALSASSSQAKPRDVAALKAMASRDDPAPAALPTVADLAAEITGVDWPAIIEKSFGLWAAGHFDRGQALWSPAPGERAYVAWQSWARRDLTPEIRVFGQHDRSHPSLARALSWSMSLDSQVKPLPRGIISTPILRAARFSP